MVGNTDAPRCLHGYAMTNLGAQKLVELFSDPWVAYQTPVDTALPSFILQGLVKGYSLEPPSIIQGKVCLYISTCMYVKIIVAYIVIVYIHRIVQVIFKRVLVPLGGGKLS